MKYILVLTLFYNGGGSFSVPHEYFSIESCKAAGQIWYDKVEKGYGTTSKSFVCLPAN